MNGIDLTNDQKEAKNEIYNELFNGSGVATLKGFAGAGKTTLLQYIIDSVEPDVNHIHLLAPTHKAAEVLRSKTQRSVHTIHSAFGLRPVPDGEGGYDFVNTGEGQGINFFFNSFLGIDEASMIPSRLYELIMEEKKSKSLKVLFCGDPAQLPPVNDNPSPSLDHNGYMLEEIVRQEKDNPIIETSMKVRNGVFDFEDKVNPQTGEGIFTIDSRSELLEKSLEYFTESDYDENSNYARVLAYKNATVNRYNQVIRSFKYGSNVPQFVEGEWIIANEPWTPLGTDSYNPIIQNNEEVVINDRNIIRIDGWFVWELFVSSSPNSEDQRRVLVLHESEKKRYEKELNKLKEEAKNEEYRWTEYYDLKEKFLDVDYTFSQTVHKAQGSTFNNVFIDFNELLTCRDIKERNSLIYVAVTRPSKKMFILN